MLLRKILSAYFCMIGICFTCWFVFFLVTERMTSMAMWIGLIIGIIGALLLEV